MTSAPFALDVTRLVQRLRHATPSGIDRVERAYLDHALARGGAVICRVGWRSHLIAPGNVAAVAEILDGAAVAPDLRARVQPWRVARVRAAEAGLRRLAAGSTGRKRLGAFLRAQLAPGAAVLNVGHDNLSVEGMAAMRAAGLRPVAMLHDTIPLDWPEFARANSVPRFRERLAAMAGAAQLIFTTRAAEAAARARAAAEGIVLPAGTVIPLGVSPARTEVDAEVAAGDGTAAPGFVCVGTIEGRKNHLLLLNIWRRLWETQPPEATPQLHVIGRRGWEAGQAIAMLDRAPMIGRTVFEHADLPDAEVARLTAGARALLFPSFAEGYGLPLVEALAAGVPVIASGLAVLREVGGEVPEWIDPLDGPGWLAAIMDYAAEPSPRRAAQIGRLEGWRAPTWESHFAALDEVLAGV
ncbi:glycosyltransferase [Limibaculum sp. M0105]|uniref:Glycosyltransferase n=1 Tax=Thermohalobaculum xanthum TaxID=2753746 RepID=A0A8J7M4C4_9RHOB|nr:glycosyltransferase [Thermohalobaculum xanthum]MBK0398091.1 glycosyltransferase [Thermohalobaculum xanthum]